MSLGLRIRLSIMMFFQYFVWGIWLAAMGLRLGETGLNLGKGEIGWIFTVYGFGAILGPFFIGQLADRYFATEKVMAFCHIVGGGLLFWTAYLTSFWPIFGVLFLYCNLYMPSMGLSNSITFRSLGEGNQAAFPGIRLWGTIGWIAAGLSYSLYLSSADSTVMQPLFNLEFIGKPDFRDCFRLAGLASLVYGVYCFTLPHTPPVPAAPKAAAEGKTAVSETLALMRFPSYAVLVGVAGLMGIMLAFYFACENYFLGYVGLPEKQIPAYMTIGQVAEAVVMLIVPITVAKLGVKATMMLGAAMWALRFGASMIGSPVWLMIGTIGLHGFCFGFFFVVAQMYVDRAASGDIKASAQNFLIFIIYGIGTIVGSVVAGQLMSLFGKNWTLIWAGPLALTLFSMAVFGLNFREEELRTIKKAEAEPELAY